MSLLLETLKVKDGIIYNIKEHEERLNDARQEYFNCLDAISLTEVIKIPEEYKEGTFRLRISYGKEILSLEFFPHVKRNIRSLKLIHDEHIDYTYKYADRVYLQKLFDQREDCDEILIIKNGYVTDTSISNVCFYNGKKWITPNTYLLRGTKRSMLLKSGALFEDSITVKDIYTYKKVSLINALLDIGEIEVDIKNIY